MTETSVERAQCCVAGCGPAGALLGLLLARAGVDVLVLEKHRDFLRDFRGDTIHASTLTVIDELGLGEELSRLPLRPTARMRVVTDDGVFHLADFRRLPGRHRAIAMLPQWDFLEFLTRAASASPSFRLRREAEVVGLLWSGQRVCGLRYRRSDGSLTEVRADLVIAADGRTSTVRAAAGMRVRDFGAPIDVLWFRLPRRDSDRPNESFGRVAPGCFLAFIDRGAYWQIAYVVKKDGAEAVRSLGLDAFRSSLTRLVPHLADRVADIASWDDVKELTVRVDRLRRWWRPGLLCVGDAAHAMSPIGGVGINLAVQDAVAAANRIALPLEEGRLRWWHLARVQARRQPPTVATQALQRLMQRGFLANVVSGRAGRRTPGLVRLLDRVPALQSVPAYLVGVGLLPEHPAPRLRSPVKVTRSPVSTSSSDEDG
jgi:2-polyprenyl-6-methoxyphenol hydroxylase-like FAD-dependent oxidoreductase